MKHTKTFPMGFWNYRALKTCGTEQVKIWHDCGMTLTHSPYFNYEIDSREDMYTLLDECEKYGIKLIMNIAGLAYSCVGNEEKYISVLKRAYEDFGNHKAVFGFHIGDEPETEEAVKNSIKAYKLNKQYAPALEPFLNLLAYPHETADHLPEIFKAADVSLISYDYYAQMNPEEDGINSYFRNLYLYSKAAMEKGCDWWTTLLSVGHFRYRCPSDDDMRWQLGTAVSSGCKGILWFYFYCSIPSNNYRNAPINEYGEKSPTYYYLSLILRRFHDMYGKLLMDLKFKSTYHFNKVYGGFEEFTVNTHNIVCMRAAHNLPGIVSFFEDEEGQEYVMLVNNSQTDSDMFYMTVDKEITKINRIELNGERVTDFVAHHQDAFYRAEDNTVGVWLAPGQMEVFTLSK